MDNGPLEKENRLLSKGKWKLLAIISVMAVIFIFFNLRIDIEPLVKGYLEDAPFSVSFESITCTPSGRLRIKKMEVTPDTDVRIKGVFESGNLKIRVFSALFNRKDLDPLLKSDMSLACKFISEAVLNGGVITLTDSLERDAVLREVRIDAALKGRKKKWIKGGISTEEIRYRGVSSGPFKTDFSGSSEKISVTNIKGTFLEGKLSGKEFSLDIADNRFSGGEIEIHNMDPGKLICPLREKDILFTADCNADLNLSESALSIDSLTGSIDLMLSDLRFERYLRFNDRILVSIAMKNRPGFSFKSIDISGNLKGLKPAPVRIKGKGDMINFSGEGEFDPGSWDIKIKVSGVFKDEMKSLILPRIWEIMPSDSAGSREFSGDITGKLYSPVIELDRNYKRRAVKGFFRKIFRR